MFFEKSNAGYRLTGRRGKPKKETDDLTSLKSNTHKRSNITIPDFIKCFENVILRFFPVIECDIKINWQDDIVKSLGSGFSYKQNKSDNIISIPIEYKNKEIASLEVTCAKEFSYNQFDRINLLADLFGQSIYHIQKSVQIENKLHQILAQKSTSSYSSNIDKQIVQYEKMQALQQLAGGMAHEFNNLLGTIIGLADYVIKNPDPGETSSALKTILEAAESASQIINKLFKFSGLQMPAKDFVHVDKLINDVLDLLADKLKKRKITVEKSFKTISEIYVDIEMLRQAIFNIVLNALEAMENGGILRIQIETNDNFVIMKFEDSGPGISADNSDNVFLPFYSTKSVVAGGSKSFNGLGLTMAYGIIFAHGGDIVAENSHDGGAIFTIKLPIKTIIN